MKPPRLAITAVVGASALLGACNAPPATTTSGPPSGIYVAASINAWGSILSQLGGTRVTTTSIITNPNTDPHSYEPTPADAIVIAKAGLLVENGVGYDTWADKALNASGDASKAVINVGSLVAAPTGGNPHLWYSPADVEKVADTITVGLKRIDAGDSDYFDLQRKLFETSLATYHQLISHIKTTYSGVKVGASESVFAPLASALGLDLITPPSFLKAISEGTDPAPSDLSVIAKQIATKQIKVYVFNSQNATPDIATQVAAAKSAGIPVSSVTETLSPVTATFQDWQVAQLKALEAALASAG